jgi:hypothetical protein
VVPFATYILGDFSDLVTLLLANRSIERLVRIFDKIDSIDRFFLIDSIDRKVVVDLAAKDWRLSEKKKTFFFQFLANDFRETEASICLFTFMSHRDRDAVANFHPTWSHGMYTYVCTGLGVVGRQFLNRL